MTAMGLHSLAWHSHQECTSCRLKKEINLSNTDGCVVLQVARRMLVEGHVECMLVGEDLWDRGAAACRRAWLEMGREEKRRVDAIEYMRCTLHPSQNHV